MASSEGRSAQSNLHQQDLTKLVSPHYVFHISTQYKLKLST